MRILLVRLSALGDVAMGLHVLAALRARLPQCRVDWLVEGRFAGLLEGHPQIDRLQVYRKPRFLRPPGPLPPIRLLRELRARRYDLALDLQGNLKSGALARLSGAARVAGLAPPLSREGNSLLVRERVAPPEGHRMAAYLRLLDATVGAGEAPPAVLPSSPSPHASIVLHPGTSRFGAFKKWPAASFAALGDRLALSLGAEVLLTAGPGEKGEAEEVRRSMRTPATVAEPQSLRALVDLLAGARIVVASDTGPAHIAALLGVPTVTLYGPKDPGRMAPVGPRALAVRKGVRCSPCALRHCPDPVCMTTLGPDEVFEKALSLLS